MLVTDAEAETCTESSVGDSVAEWPSVADEETTRASSIAVAVALCPVFAEIAGTIASSVTADEARCPREDDAATATEPRVAVAPDE